MKTALAVLALAAVVPAAARNRGIIDTSRSSHVKQRPVDMTAARWTRGVWADRFQLAHTVSLPAMWRLMQGAGNSANFLNLKIAAGLDQGKFPGNDWDGGDVCKAMETMAALFAYTGVQKLAGTMDEAIAVIGKAQTPEGYIGTHTQLTGKQRWGNLRYHEL